MHDIVGCSMFPRSTHETFAQKLYQTFKDDKRFIKPKLSQTDFTISHYAGEVSFMFGCYRPFDLEGLVILFKRSYLLCEGNLSSQSVPGQEQRLYCC